MNRLNLSHTETATRQTLKQSFNQPARWTVALGTLAASILLATAAQAASFMGLGDLPGGNFASGARGISADGLVVVGSGSSENGGEAFRWTAAEGMVGLGDLPGGDFGSIAFGVSADGAVIVGRGSTPNNLPNSSGSRKEAFRWTAAEGMVGLGHLPGSTSIGQAFDVSADGTVIVGESGSANTVSTLFGDSEAFRWTAEEGMVGLGDLPGGDFFSEAFAISADGSTIVGRSQNGPHNFGAFRWTADEGMVGLSDFAIANSRSNDVSADGSVIVGRERQFPFFFEAFRWTEADDFVLLGDLPGGGDPYITINPFFSEALAVSADGSIIVGFSNSNRGDEAFIWDEINGIRPLFDVLTDDFGLDLTGWHLIEARDISADGRTIVGGGRNPEGKFEAWIAQLDPASTPEPSALLGLGILTLTGILLRRRTKGN